MNYATRSARRLLAQTQRSTSRLDVFKRLEVTRLEHSQELWSEITRRHFPILVKKLYVNLCF